MKNEELVPDQRILKRYDINYSCYLGIDHRPRQKHLFYDFILLLLSRTLLVELLVKYEGLQFGQYCTQQWPQDWKRSVFIPIPKKGNAKECSDYRTIALISHARKVMLNILQARLQQYMNRELPDVQAGFRKGRGTRDQIANIHNHGKSKRVPEKHLFLLY